MAAGAIRNLISSPASTVSQPSDVNASESAPAGPLSCVVRARPRSGSWDLSPVGDISEAW